MRATQSSMAIPSEERLFNFEMYWAGSMKCEMYDMVNEVLQMGDVSQISRQLSSYTLVFKAQAVPDIPN